MIHTFHNVDGCCLQLSEPYSIIAFPSRADALFASLILKYGEYFESTAYGLINDVLQLVRTDGFRVEQLTIRNSYDVFNVIADEQRMAAEKRDAKNLLKTLYQKGLNVVAELVAEHISRTVLYASCHPNCYHEHADSFEAQGILRALSLVHPAWTNMAQRQLRRCAIVNGPSQLFPAHSNPRLGPWVHELVFLERNDSFRTKHVCVFDAIVERCPNAKRLIVQRKGEIDEYDFPSYRNFLQRVMELEQLQWLAFDEVCGIDIWEVCSILPHLRSLRKLRMYNCFTRDAGGEKPIHLQGQKPSPTLRSITLLDMRCGAGHVIWFLEPLGSYEPRILETDTKIIALLEGSNPTVASTITHLQINDFYDTGGVLRSNIGRFHSIHSLTLCLDSTYEVIPGLLDFHLPRSIRSFAFHMFLPSTSILEWCRRYVMRPSPDFRKLLFTYTSDLLDEDDKEALTEARKALAQVCAEKNIELGYTSSTHCPTFLDSP